MTFRVWNGEKFEERENLSPFTFSTYVVVMVGKNQIYLASEATFKDAAVAVVAVINA